MHEAYTVTFVEQPSFSLSFWISVKINGITNLRTNQLSKRNLSPCEIIFAIFCAVLQRVLTFFTTSMLAMS